MKIKLNKLCLPLLVLVVVSGSMSSCNVNSHVMLKTPNDFVFDSLPENQPMEYVLTRGDNLSFRMFSNGGFSVIDMASGAGNGSNNMARNNANFITYAVQPDGTVKLPILGDVMVKGMTVRETEEYLEDAYGEFYVDPFLQLNVSNKRVIVFPGTGSNAQVVTLQNNTVTLMEVLAQVGGITADSKADLIKIIRTKPSGEREVYKVDLSVIDGLDEATLIVQANDIIYVQPNANIAREILQEVSPIVSVVTSTVLIYFTIRNISNP